MQSSEIRSKFINYFTQTLKSKGFQHNKIPYSSLVPEQHPTLLFTNSGMVQLTPYFLGEKDPVADFGSKRLTDAQKCIRTGDLDVVGKSKYHLTFFEMLGSWSIGDYGKEKAVEFAFDLLTDKNYGYGFDGSRFIATVFCGNEETECDIETINAWKKVGISDKKISKLPVSENWWTVGGYSDPGPCGPCTEILFDRGPEYGPEEEVPGMTDNPRYLEIWNAGVFMEYNRDSSGKLIKLPKLSVDTGAGLERFTLLMQKAESVYETDLFTPIINKIKSLKVNLEKKDSLFALRRISDHIKASSFVISEFVYPSNKDQGYVLRRLLRNSFDDLTWKLDADPKLSLEIVPVIIDLYKEIYPEINNVDHITSVIEDEIKKYDQVVKQARYVIKRNYQYKHQEVNAFEVYQSTGASLDLVKQISAELNLKVNEENFDKDLVEHQEKSKSGAGQKFKGGLEGHSDNEIRLHTATHLLHKALREVLGEEVQQMGSNITADRLRFDFSYPEKLTLDQISEIENIINSKIKESLPVKMIKLPKDEAIKTGAFSFFKEKYSDEVTLYYTGDSLETSWSKEFCGGPHVTNTSEIKGVKIIKEEAVGRGVRRIKAILIN
jgi:alanyl-tRNA synthetase